MLINRNLQPSLTCLPPAHGAVAQRHQRDDDDKEEDAERPGQVGQVEQQNDPDWHGKVAQERFGGVVPPEDDQEKVSDDDGPHLPGQEIRESVTGVTSMGQTFCCPEMEFLKRQGHNLLG